MSECPESECSNGACNKQSPYPPRGVCSTVLEWRRPERRFLRDDETGTGGETETSSSSDHIAARKKAGKRGPGWCVADEEVRGGVEAGGECVSHWGRDEEELVKERVSSLALTCSLHAAMVLPSFVSLANWLSWGFHRTMASTALSPTAMVLKSGDWAMRSSRLTSRSISALYSEEKESAGSMFWSRSSVM